VKVEIERAPKSESVSIQKFAEIRGLVMKVVERHGRDNKDPMRFYAEFKNCEERRGMFLVSNHGNGSTPTDAMIDYTEKISGKLIVLNAYSPERREIQAPILYFDKEAAANL
jgi:hypothetical protein